MCRGRGCGGRAELRGQAARKPFGRVPHPAGAHHHSQPAARLPAHLPLGRYSKQWEVTVRRLGRWIDFENDYKTLDPSFMESVW